MNQQILVVKSHGKSRTEVFDPGKLKKSIVAVCLSLKTPDGQAEEIANNVVRTVEGWARDRQEITSADIRRVGSEILKKIHPEAAYLYKQQLTVL